MILAIVQARMNSQRFPGKMIQPMGGKPLISFILERVKKAKLVDEIVLATTTTSHDDVLFEEARA